MFEALPQLAEYGIAALAVGVLLVVVLAAFRMVRSSSSETRAAVAALRIELAALRVEQDHLRDALDGRDRAPTDPHGRTPADPARPT